VCTSAPGLYTLSLHDALPISMALPGNPVERTAGMLWGLVVAGGVVAGPPKLWGAGLGLAVIGGLMFALLHADDLPGAMHRLGLSDRKSTRLNSSHLVISYAVF